MSVYIDLCVWLYVSGGECLCVSVLVSVRMCVSACLCVYLCVSVYVCVSVRLDTSPCVSI